MTKKIWNPPAFKAYGSVEQLTEQTTTINKVPGSGDTIVLNVNGETVATINGAGDVASLTFQPH